MSIVGKQINNNKGDVFNVRNNGYDSDNEPLTTIPKKSLIYVVHGYSWFFSESFVVGVFKNKDDAYKAMINQVHEHYESKKDACVDEIEECCSEIYEQNRTTIEGVECIELTETTITE